MRSLMAALCVALAPLTAALSLLPAATSRRQLVRSSFATALACGSSRPASAATVANPSDMLVFKVRKYAVKVTALRAAVKSGGAGAAERVAHERTSVLEPLQQAMAAAAPGLVLLSAEQLAVAARQPQLLAGHCLALATVGAGDYGEFVSTTSGAVYRGGRVERELEQVEEEVAAFLELATLARGRLAGE